MQRSVFLFVCVIWVSPRLSCLSPFLMRSAAPSLRHLFNLGTSAASLHLGNGTWVGTQDVDELGSPLMKNAGSARGEGSSSKQEGIFFFFFFVSTYHHYTNNPNADKRLLDDDDQFAAVASHHKMRWMRISVQQTLLSSQRVSL